MNEPIGYVRADRQLAMFMDGTSKALTLSPGAAGLMWGTWAHAGPSLGHSWPTFSPDGKHLACFQVPLTEEAGDESALVVLDRAGVSEVRLMEQEGLLPIYLQWSPDGTTLALLSQQEDHLVVSTVRRADAEVRTIARGSPLFFTWLPDSRLCAFVGGSPGRAPQITIFDLQDGQRTTPLPGEPGNFCAPIALGDRVFYVAERNLDEWVLRAATLGPADEVVDLEVCDGLVALVGDERRTTLVRGLAPDGDGTPYQELVRIDPVSLEIEPLWNQDCLAYLLTPKADALVIATVDTRANLIRLHHAPLDGSPPSEFHAFHPSRDMGFYLRYFEQFSQSHRLISSDGTEMLVSGTTPEEGPRGEPIVWRVPLDGSEPIGVDEGVFAVFGPA